MSKSFPIIDSNYWDLQYSHGNTGWDVGYAIPAIVAYFEQIENKDVKILIPGAGTAHEGIYLYNNGFKNIFLLDYSSIAVEMIKENYPDFPQKQIIYEDFYKHCGDYDFIIEHTFFSAIKPKDRYLYVEKTHELLKNGGKLVGLLFDRTFEGKFPPYGGNKNDYKILFSEKFFIKTMETAINSIKPRKNNELFVIFEKI